MAAARLDIVLEEDANIQFDFTYKDETGTPIDVNGYGATLVFRKEDNEIVFTDGHASGAVSLASDGLITLNVPHTQYDNLPDGSTGRWQLYIFPNTAEPETDRIRLIEGEWVYSSSLI